MSRFHKKFLIIAIVVVCLFVGEQMILAHHEKSSTFYQAWKALAFMGGIVLGAWASFPVREE